MTKIRRTVSIALMLAVAFTFMPMIDGQAIAASKSPAKPKITKATVSANTVTVKWGKAKKAKKYQVAVRSAGKKWVKYKTVKKTGKNKRKFTKKNKYKVAPRGKKYIVYQYTYTYTKKKNTKARTFKFTGLKYNTTYTFAVRSVNGKKYSAWSTVTRKTKAKPVANNSGTAKSYNKPGEKVPLTIGGVTNTLVIGQETTYNFPDTTGLNTDLKSIKVNPREVEIDNYVDNYGSHCYAVNVYGKINGLDGKYGEGKIINSCSRGYWAGAGDPWVKHPCGVEILPTGTNLISVNVTNPNTKVYWTLDGTEPTPGQEDLTVAGSDYPLGTLKRERIYSPEPATIKIRGTVSNGETANIFEETTAEYINKCIWIKIYSGNTLVGEYYDEVADEQFWPYDENGYYIGVV